MGSYQAVIDEDALEFLADISGGDARSALNAVETWNPDNRTKCRRKGSASHWMLHPNAFRNV